MRPALGAGPAQALDLAAEARAASAAGAALVVMFTQPDCPCCEAAKLDYLKPATATEVHERLHI